MATERGMMQPMSFLVFYLKHPNEVGPNETQTMLSPDTMTCDQVCACQILLIHLLSFFSLVFLASHVCAHSN